MFRISDRTLKRARQPGRQSPAAKYQTAICPRCRLMIRDRVAIGAGYCARCQEFTLMCAAGRALISPDVTARTSWHWPCTSIGAARWQVTRGTGPAFYLLCPDHDAELAAGYVSWIEHPLFLGPAWSAPR
jgi:hypothetical protein